MLLVIGLASIRLSHPSVRPPRRPSSRPSGNMPILAILVLGVLILIVAVHHQVLHSQRYHLTRPSLHLFTHLPSSSPHSLSSSPSPSTIVVATFTVPVAVVLRRSFPAESATNCGPYVRDRDQVILFDGVAIVLYPGIEPQLLATHARLAECRGHCSILVQQRGRRKH